MCVDVLFVRKCSLTRLDLVGVKTKTHSRSRGKHYLTQTLEPSHLLKLRTETLLLYFKVSLVSETVFSLESEWFYCNSNCE